MGQNDTKCLVLNGRGRMNISVAESAPDVSRKHRFITNHPKWRKLPLISHDKTRKSYIISNKLGHFNAD